MSAERSFSVDGMSCASCATSVEKSVCLLEGVSGASVNFATRTLAVTLAPGASGTMEPDVAGRLEALGYRARPLVEARAAESSDGSGDDEVLVLARRLAVVGFFAMNAMLPGAALYMGAVRGEREAWWLALASGLLALPALVLGGGELARHAARELRSRAPGMNTLVVAGVLVTSAISVVAVLQKRSDVYFDTAAMIVAFALLGRLLEAYARRRGMGAVRALRALAPPRTTLVGEGGSVVVEVQDVEVGDVVRVGAGERFALDGVVTAGTSFIDTSMLTGEWEPQIARAGTVVHAGCLNHDGILDVRVTLRLGARRIDAIAAAVDAFLGRRAPLQQVADRVARLLSLGVAMSALGAFGFVAWSEGLGSSHAWLRAAAVLVVACPCAIGLAVPMVLVVAAGRAAQRGVMYRDARAVDVLATVTDVVLDKTGTLTEGAPSLSKVVAASGVDMEWLARLASRLEVGVDHPFAAALRGAAEPLQLEGTATVRPGRGVLFAATDGDYRAGSERWLREEGVDMAGAVSSSSSAVHVAHGQRWLGAFVFEDTLCEDVGEVVHALSSRGLTLHIVSGDTAAAVARVASAAGISLDMVAAERLPEEKASYVEALRRGGARVAFVGDGINDGLALVAADVGVAVEGSTELATEAADVVVIEGGLAALVTALDLARATRSAMRMNLAWAIGYNVAAIPAAAVGLLTPALAAVVMALSSVSVALNALRLRAPASSPTVSRPTLDALHAHD
jgi:heavy metal translocating P-type ATPase